MEKTEKTVQPSFPAAKLGCFFFFLISNSLYFTLCHIFAFQYAAHFLYWWCATALEHLPSCGSTGLWEPECQARFFTSAQSLWILLTFTRALPQGNFLPLWRNTVKPANAFPLKRVLGLSWCGGAECYKLRAKAPAPDWVTVVPSGFLAAVPAMWQSWPPGPEQGGCPLFLQQGAIRLARPLTWHSQIYD